MIGGPNASETAAIEIEKYSTNRDFQVFIAKIDSSTVGFGVVKNNPFEGGDGIAELGLFQIKEEYRNQGIGTMLFNSIENTLRAAATRKLYTKVNPKNIRAVVYWLRRGFEFEARLSRMNIDTDYYLLSKVLMD